MRQAIDVQDRLVFSAPTLEETRRVYQRYDRISMLLDRSPEITRTVHSDLVRAQALADEQLSARQCDYTSDSVLRCLLVMVIEGLSLREVTVRIDDSTFLRRFTRLHDGAVMHYSTLTRLKNAIDPTTWQAVNRVLVEAAVSNKEISGEELRVDTTAVEANVHHPTDSTLLLDSYCVLARLIKRTRTSVPELVGDFRVHQKRVKREVQKIFRLVGKKNSGELMKGSYEQILREIRRIRERAGTLAIVLEKTSNLRKFAAESDVLRKILQQLRHYLPLVDNVIDQATRRVIEGESVPNDEKIFSLFEPHTELLKRGKSWRSIEYGHMVQFEQVRSKVITGYEVFSKKPNEPDLLREVVEKHSSIFGAYPDLVTTDKGYSEKTKIEELHQLGIRTSIGRKGRNRDPETLKHEHSDEFRSAQAFRAGIEGTIAFLKSGLGLRRCLNRGWDHFVATIGLSVLAHNLIKLAT